MSRKLTPAAKENLAAIKALYRRARDFHHNQTMRLDHHWNSASLNLDHACDAEAQATVLKRLANDLAPLLAVVPPDWPTPGEARKTQPLQGV